jgi:molybdopterin/thiamine biosynthesis adenylyltransferase
MAEKGVAIVGVGSGGSEIAANLACMGLGKLTIIDSDRLEPPNYIRHTATRIDLARQKVAAIETGLRDRDLPVRTTSYFADVFYQADEFREVLQKTRPDLLICATDSRESRRFVNYCGVRFGIPTIIAGTLDSGRIGEVLLVKPHRTACYECVRIELGTSLIVPDTEGRPRTAYVPDDAHEDRSTALRFDVSFVAALSTRVALQILAPEMYSELPTAYLAPFDFDFPMTLKYVPISRRNSCPVCSDLQSDDVEGAASKILGGLNDLPTS